MDCLANNFYQIDCFKGRARSEYLRVKLTYMELRLFIITGSFDDEDFSNSRVTFPTEQKSPVLVPNPRAENNGLPDTLEFPASGWPPSIKTRHHHQFIFIKILLTHQACTLL